MLFDYDRAEAKALAATLAEVGIDFDAATHARYREINTAAWQAFERGEITQAELRPLRFAKLFAACDRSHADPQQAGERYIDHLANCGDLIDGALDVLRTLRGTASLALITNGIAEVQNRRLDHSGIRPFFDSIVISGEVGVAKPDPAIFALACAHLRSTDKDGILMVGDSLSSDIRGAQAFGVDACWIRPDDHPSAGTSGARFECAKVTELLALLGESLRPS